MSKLVRRLGAAALVLAVTGAALAATVQEEAVFLVLSLSSCSSREGESSLLCMRSREGRARASVTAMGATHTHFLGSCWGGCHHLLTTTPLNISPYT